MPQIIGLLHGMERAFPGALAERINQIAGGKVVAEPVSIGAVTIHDQKKYAVILDRISHEVPFYRAWLKQAAHQGTQVVNNPFWFSADDKYFGCLVAEQSGVASPKTALLPHREHPTGTEATSFSNLEFPVAWEKTWEYLGFPLFMKPADGGGWKDVYRCADPDEFFDAYSKTHTLHMMAQEEIVFHEYYRCYCIGRERTHIMRYDPKAPHHERYVQNPPEIEPALREKMERDIVALCRALGYDFNTVEFAIRDGIPYAIDYTNPCPDAEPTSVGEENYAWVLENSAEFLIERALNPIPIEVSGTWPQAHR